ncbi:MAG: cytochrome b/b6 domain-containing protein [Gammaproteobacteria bacterium]
MSAESSPMQLDRVSRALHLGLAVFGVWAWWIGEDAGDYKHADHFWYTQHMWVGIIFTAFLLLRIVWGIFGPASARFSNWVPWTKVRFLLVIEDIRTLLRFRVPDRPSHVGLAGLVQALGLLAFLWLGLTGLALIFLITPGMPLTGWPHALKELHGIGDVLVPAYLILHVGAVVLHIITGNQIWKKMIFLE